MDAKTQTTEEAFVQHMITKYAIQDEKLAEAELAACILAALKCGDFQRHVVRNADSSSGRSVVVYRPAVQLENLRASVRKWINALPLHTQWDWMREAMAQCVGAKLCPACKGTKIVIAGGELQTCGDCHRTGFIE